MSNAHYREGVFVLLTTLILQLLNTPRSEELRAGTI